MKVGWSPTKTWLSITAASMAFWLLMGQLSVWRSVLVVALSLASFSVGSIAGFLFTSYGEESATVGKVRDWLIGGLTGLTIAKISSIKAILLTFAAAPGPQEFAITIGVCCTYLGLGFFFMFFQRELILNVLLAESRAQRSRIDGTNHAGLVTQKLLAAFPPSLLSGIDDIDDLVQKEDPEAEKLKSLLYSEDVETFLKEAEDATKSGQNLDWDVISKVAYLQYYRTYFEKGDKKDRQEETADEWLLRALLMNPRHADLTAKRADVSGMMKNYSEAVAILERLIQSPEAPAYVEQWLGYFLLFLPGREHDAIKYSDDYHARFPDESDSLFNSACAFAQLYCKEIKDCKMSADLSSEFRRKALEKLREGLLIEPEFAETVRNKLTEPGDSFDCMSTDSEFRYVAGFENGKNAQEGKTGENAKS